MIPLFVLIFIPFIRGDWHSSNLHWTIGGPWGGWRIAFVWLFLNAWSAYGIEVAASFAPEYHDTKRDTALALRSAAMFSMLVYIFLPMTIGGSIGVDALNKAGAEGQFYVPLFNHLVGSGLASVMLILVLASLVLSMNSSTADGGRALYGISRAGMTIRELGVLNRFHVPARAMTVDLIVNVGLVLFVSSNLAILYLSNIGYVFAHVAALSGFLLLRKDRPDWPRPIKVAPIWLPIAGLLVVANLVFLIVGAGSPKLNGYGTWGDFWIGIAVLAISIVLYVFRIVVQDRHPLRWREETPKLPPEDVAAPPTARGRLTPDSMGGRRGAAASHRSVRAPAELAGDRARRVEQLGQRGPGGVSAEPRDRALQGQDRREARRRPRRPARRSRSARARAPRTRRPSRAPRISSSAAASSSWSTIVRSV